MRESALSGRDGTDRLLNRRSYLTAAGGVITAVLGMGSAAADGNGNGGTQAEGETESASEGSESTQDGDESEAAGNGSADGEAAAIGGGDGYGNVVTPADATVTVATRSELEDALESAGSGDVVYVEGGAEIEMGTTECTIPSGVTLASDRGVDGADGAHLTTADSPWGMFTARDDVRITGLRVGGPRWDWIGNVDGELGIDVKGSGVEVDNCEIYGWGYASVTTASETHVHHCAIHHNPKDGTGYGVATLDSERPMIEYNVFHHNRHSVASSDGGYVARFNHVKQGAIAHVFDQHKPGGTTIEIYNNTVEAVENATKDKKAPAVAIRGVPDDVAAIHDNWFFNSERPRDDPDGWTDEAIIQVHTDDWKHVDFENNHYGSDEPAPDVGHPR